LRRRIKAATLVKRLFKSVRGNKNDTAMATDNKKDTASRPKSGDESAPAPAPNSGTGDNGNGQSGAERTLEIYKKAARDLIGDDGARAIDDRVEEIRSEKSGRRKRKRKATAK